MSQFSKVYLILRMNLQTTKVAYYLLRLLIFILSKFSNFLEFFKWSSFLGSQRLRIILLQSLNNTEPHITRLRAPQISEA